jgi:4,5-dihydroxyphthalate decarboxylase
MAQVCDIAEPGNKCHIRGSRHRIHTSLDEPPIVGHNRDNEDLPEPKPELRITFRRTPLTEALLDGRVESSRIQLRFVPVEPISRAFRRAIRDKEFDVAEMALVTLAMAQDIGQPWKGLPVVLLRGFHHGALRVPPDSPIRGPEDLPGHTTGVRAYSQTTGVWLRGILDTEYGIAPSRMRWITTEDAHVPGFQDPQFVSRAPEGVKLQDLFASREIDAAIGDNSTNFGDTRSVIHDPEAAAASWARRTGIHPVNHVLALRPGLVDEFSGIDGEIRRLFDQARILGGADAERDTGASVDAGLGFAWSQGLTRRRYTFEDLFLA